MITPPTLGAGGTLYFGDAAGGLHAYAANGVEAWSTVLPGSAVAFAPTLSPTGALLRVSVATATGGKLVAVGPTGSVVWERALSAKPTGSPVVAPDGTSYVLDDKGVVSAVRADGTVAWDLDFTDASGALTFVAQPRLGPDGSIIVQSATFTGNLRVVNQKVSAIHASGAPKWTYAAAAGTQVGPPLAVASDGTVYVPSTTAAGERLLAIGPSGAKAWELAIPGRARSASIGKNGTLLLQTDVLQTLTVLAVTN